MRFFQSCSIAVLMLFLGGVALASGGRVDSLELLDRIQPGVTTAQQVRDLLGAPAQTMHFPSQGLDALVYDAREFGSRLLISISIGSDGVVRGVLRKPISSP